MPHVLDQCQRPIIRCTMKVGGLRLLDSIGQLPIKAHIHRSSGLAIHLPKTLWKPQRASNCDGLFHMLPVNRVLSLKNSLTLKHTIPPELTSRSHNHHITPSTISFSSTANSPGISTMCHKSITTAVSSSLRQYTIRSFSGQSRLLNRQITPPGTSLVLAQSFESSVLWQNLKRALWLSAPIIAIYFLAYLISSIPANYRLSRISTGIVDRFWNYKRCEWLQTGYSPITWITSQFAHDSPTLLAFDILALISVAIVLGPFVDGRTFFVIYLLGGFISANLDCAWTWATNPCRGASAEGYKQRVIEVNQFIAEIKAGKSYRKSWSEILSRKFDKKVVETPDQRKKRREEAKEHVQGHLSKHRRFRDFRHWCQPNFGANGSLTCLCKKLSFYSMGLSQFLSIFLVTVAAFMRPRTLFYFVLPWPKVRIYKLVLGVTVCDLGGELLQFFR